MMRTVACVLLVGCVALGCATPSFQVDRARARARIIDKPVGGWMPDVTAPGADAVLASGLANVRSIEAQLVKLESAARDLRAGLGARRRGYFTADETDRIEGLLFRYLACRESLWDLIAFYGSRDRSFGDETQQTQALLVALHAAAVLSHYSSKLVLAYLDDDALKEKLNEEHFLYDIPRGSYDELFRSVTSRANLAALREAWSRIDRERGQPGSALAKLLDSDAAYRSLVEDTGRHYDASRAAVARILRKRSVVDADLSNMLRHSRLMREARRAERDVSENLYVAKGLLMSRIGDFKRPEAEHLKFTPEQSAALRALLRPGDLLFTYTAGYMSNVFLPGICKHGIVYVGSPEERRAAGVSEDLLTAATAEKRAALARALATDRLPGGHEADVVEAVSEGVIFNSVEHLMETHINRMVVLRPRVSDADRAGALLATFLMVGGQYDFSFDFADASYLCCTEVIYRALHNRGGISFTLLPRFGAPTLCADDILLYHLRAPERLFDVVAIAEEDPGSPRQAARVETGAEAEARLRHWYAEKLAQAP